MQKYLKRIYSQDKNSFYKELANKLETSEKCFVVTVNPESIMQVQNDEDLNKLLLDDNVTLVPDGIAVVKKCRKNDFPVKERITGIDIASYLLTLANDKKYSMYLYGAKDEVINSLVSIINKNYPNINILGYSNGYVDNKDSIMEQIVSLQPDICMVALGIPDQEKLIYKYYDKFTKGIFIGVGGSFDVLSGTKKRAPKIFIKLNLEWLYRILCEPKRIKRFWNNNIKFYFKK